MKFIKKLFGSSNEREMPEIVFGVTDVGKVRKGNEDYFLVSSDKNLHIVADGMGGHRAGAVASLHATKAVDNYFTTKLLSKLKGNNEDIKDQMITCLLNANRKILEMAKTDREYDGMGCTIVVAFVDRDTLHICHIGDARAYVSDHTRIKLLTTDHSRVMQLVNDGKMTMEEARKSPIKNELTQAIGSPVSINPGYSHHTLKKGDKILLCSDGLWDMLPDQKIYEFLSQNKPARAICEELIEMANNAGGRDNITAVVIVHKGLEMPIEGDFLSH